MALPPVEAVYEPQFLIQICQSHLAHQTHQSIQDDLNLLLIKLLWQMNVNIENINKLISYTSTKKDAIRCQYHVSTFKSNNYRCQVLAIEHTFTVVRCRQLNISILLSRLKCQQLN